MTRSLLLPRSFARQASETPGAVAVVDQDHRLSYQQLASEAGLLADRLRTLGVGPGSLVGVLLPACADLPTALLAVWHAGAAYLLLDPAVPGEPTAAAIGEAGIKMVLTHQALADRVGPAQAICLDQPTEPGGVAEARPFADREDAPAFVSRTAEGALLTVDHASAARYALGLAERHELSAADRVLCTGAVGRLPWEVFAALSSGAALVMGGSDPAGAARTHGVTVLPVSGAFAAAQRPQEYTGVRLVVATDLAPAALARWAEGTGAKLWQSYGPDVCGVELAAGPFDPEQPHTAVPGEQPELWVLDEYGDPVPPGVPGELHVGALGCAYVFPGRPDTTADRLVPDLDGEPGARLLRTGLLVRLRHDGSLELLGQAAEPAAAPAAFARPAYLAPRTPEEALVAGIWSELLEQDEIGVADNFFQLGGHSLLLTRLTERLCAATGRRLALTEVYRALTVEAQAKLITAGADELPPVRPVSRQEPLPLSSGQRRLWFVDSVSPSPEWIIPLFLRLPAEVSEQTAQRALAVLTERHESLRTHYVKIDGEPMQQVGEAQPVEWRELDAASPEREAVFRAQFETGFDLASGRLLRALLVREADGERWLLVTIHHIACDGWSATVLEQEFQQLCADLTAGREPQLPALDVQYADFAAWQGEHRDEQRLAEELGFWRTALDGLSPLELPTDHPRPAERDPRGDLVPFTIPAPLAEAVAELGQRHGATPFMILLTAFSTLLARHTGQWDVPVGVPVAGRNRPELERMVGFFLNSLVLRCRLDPSLGFTEALDAVRDVALDGFAHQDVPFERLVEELRPERDPSRTPLYQVAFNFNDGPVNGGMPDHEHGAYLYARQAAKTDLTLYVRTEADGSWTGVLEYATTLFERATVERLGAGLVRLVESVTAAPGTALGAAEILPADARAEVLNRWNATGADWERVPVADLIERQAAATPDALAVAYGSVELSYRELDERANRLAHRLRSLGAGPDTPVGVLLQRGPELLPALLGVWKAGAAYIPMDPSNPAERIEHIVQDSGARLLITDSTLASVAAGHQGALVLLDTDRAAIDAEPATRPERLISPDHLAYVIYTSGSTGRPKGVMVTHAGLSNHLQWAARELITTPGGAPLFSSIAFDLPATNLFAPLMAGQPVHLMPADLDLGALGRTLAASGPYSFIKLAAGHLELLAHQLTDEQIERLAQWIVVAGEALTPKVANRWSRALGSGRLINEYGPTENSIGSTIHPVTHEYDTTVPLGLPLPNTTGYILDATGRPVPLGVIGELCVAGDGLARGYLGRPDLTAEKFVPHPYGPAGARLYRTGDLTRRLPDGAIAFLGRMDNQVKLRGYRIELGEIETQLLTAPAIRAAAVIVRENQAGEKALAAYLVPADGATVDPAEVREQLATALPEYMVPSTFTVLETLPLTSNGKLDHRALPQAQATGGRYEPPATPTEERIAEIWSEVLGREQISVEDSFFELGGHSILAIRMVSMVQDAFDLDIPIRTVFEFATIRRLAEAVEDLIRAELDQLTDAELGSLAEEYHA